MVKTTLRLKENLKKAAEKIAFEEDKSLQEIFNAALENYLETQAYRAAEKIIFKTHDLGEPLDNLKRGDYYPHPK